MSLSYIRSYYNVPAYEGHRVEYTGGSKTELGTIVGAVGAHLLVRRDGCEESSPFHPTWKIRYLEDEMTALLGDGR